MAHSSPAAQGSQAGGVVLIEHLPSMCKAGGWGDAENKTNLWVSTAQSQAENNKHKNNFSCYTKFSSWNLVFPDPFPGFIYPRYVVRLGVDMGHTCDCPTQ